MNITKEEFQAAIKAAFDEGYSEGHSNGLSDGHPLTRFSRDTARQDEDEAWEWSETKESLDKV